MVLLMPTQKEACSVLSYNPTTAPATKRTKKKGSIRANHNPTLLQEVLDLLICNGVVKFRNRVSMRINGVSSHGVRMQGIEAFMETPRQP